MPRRAGFVVLVLFSCLSFLAAQDGGQELGGAIGSDAGQAGGGSAGDRDAGAGNAAAAGAVTLAFQYPALPPALSSRPVMLLPPAAGQSAGTEYRFSGCPYWTAFDSPLELDAAYGEERSYVLEFRDSPGTAPRRLELRIDRLPPKAPVMDPPEGLYRHGVQLAMSAGPGSTIRYSISRAGSEAAAFVAFDQARQPLLELPATGSSTVVVVAYAVDEAGNASPIVRSAYRLAAPGPAYSAPPPAAPPPVMAPGSLEDLADPAVTRLAGYTALDFRPPEGSVLYVSVNPAAMPSSFADFLPLQSGDGPATLAFPCPPGWIGKASIYVGLLRGPSFAFREVPFMVDLDGLGSGASPMAPSLLASIPAGPVYLVFAPFAGDILYSVDRGEYRTYEGPVPMDRGRKSLELSWYGRSPTGDLGPRHSVNLAVPAQAAAIALLGPAWDTILDDDVSLTVSGQGFLRYELGSDGAMPQEPQSSSPQASGTITVSCPAGEERTFIVRYRDFAGPGADAAGGEGGILRFTIDRKAPLPPVIVAPAESYSSQALTLSFKAQEGKVFMAVEVDGKEAAFSAAPPSIELKGSDEGPTRYVVRAYAVDAAGNRSAECEPVAVTVDMATVYVSEDGSDTGDGSRVRPFASLDAAMKAALDPGRPRTAVAIRGRVPYSGTTALGTGSRLTVRGGFDAAWNPQEGGMSAIVRGKGQDPLFTVSGASLSMEDVAIEAGELSGPVLFSLSSASLSLVDVSIAASSDGDILIVDAVGSAVRLASTSVSMEGAVSACVIQTRDCGIVVEDSKLAAGQAVRYFSGINATGGSLALRASAFSSRAALGTRLIALKAGSIDVEAAYFDLRGASGFLSVGSFEDCQGRIADSRGYVEWEGGVTLFRLKGSSPIFVHDSFYAVTAKGSVRFFDCTGTTPMLRNCILGAKGLRNELVSSDQKPLPGQVSANCLWGFYFCVSGAISLRDVATLNSYNSADATALPNIVEAPELTYGALPPGSFFNLAPGSACLGAGMPLAGYPEDFEGDPRPAADSGKRPDIGADQESR